ncbi:hypothetical protein [Paucibacter sp. DJ2R-2]|uniref:hypothetical protein n=1 Tax=Paucibacter sp. DJ2R-2 TaxID=2893558 RepID=UPI0021E4B7AA|nr:hypothetical protein [Paucibacter sp. DJ2R-2]MCV2438591.1 hypothetical protein [Paucibacter sp. DJ2R-2]
MTLNTNNEQFRDLVASTGLPSAVAMTIFNRGLGANACTASAWAGYLSEPGSPQYRELNADLLKHAEAQFAAAVR